MTSTPYELLEEPTDAHGTILVTFLFIMNERSHVQHRFSIQFFFILSRLHILQQQEVYIYKMQFDIGSMAAKIYYAYTKIKLTNLNWEYNLGT